MGGCCLVAWLIAEAFEQLNIKYKIRLYLREENNSKLSIRNNFRNGNMEVFRHIALVVNNISINDDPYFVNSIDVSCIKSDWLKDCYISNPNWNEYFDPKYSILIERELINFFNKYEKR